MDREKMVKIPVICMAYLLISLSVLHASEQILTAEHTHGLSDNESKNDARRICFVKAKQKLFAQTFDLFMKQKSVKMEAFSEKDIEQTLPILLEISMKSETWEFIENRLSIRMVAQTGFDKDFLEKQMVSLQNDEEAQKKIKKDRNRLQKLEQDYIALEKKIAAANEETAVPIRKKRQILSSEMDRIERVKYVISSKTKLVSDKITTGMTIDEMITIAGQPRSTATCEKPDFLNYGNIWIWISNGIVIGKIPMEKWSGPCYRYSLTDRDTQAAAGVNGYENKDKTEEPKYSILLKTGKNIFTSTYYELNEVVYYKKYGGIVGIEKEKVETINEIE